MKKNKGFTLIELLAVIVILAVVSIVAIPIVINMIEEAKKGALKDSVEGLTKAADMYYFQNMKGAEEGVQIEIINNEQTAPQSPKLNYKGDVKNGFVLISYDGKVAVCVDDNKYFASRALDTKEIIVDVGSCTSEFDDELNTFVTVGSANYTGLRLSVKKFAAPSKIPSSLSDSTIAVVTDTNISSYYASPYAPDEPKEGMVWVILDDDADQTIKTKTSEIGIAYVVQYEDGNWNLKDSYIFKDKNKTQLVEYDRLSTEWTYDYKGEYEEFKAPYSGYYEIQLWGGSGGTGIYNKTAIAEQGGLGAYTKGDIYLNKDDILYVYVGGQGASPSRVNQHAYIAGGWNGGANGSSGGTDDIAAGGGGATDIRTKPTASKNVWNEAESLKSRIMVAAGGGGGHSYNENANNNRKIFEAINGGGVEVTGISGYWQSGTWTPVVNQTNGYAFGYGQQYTSLDGTHGAGGGGGGWYGGYTVTSGAGGLGSGGSSYISGHKGCIAIDNLGYHTGTTVSYTNLFFTNTKMIDGNGYQWTNVKGSLVGMPNYNDGTIMNGNEGPGHAVIRFKGFDSLNENQYEEYMAENQNSWLYKYKGYYQVFTAPKTGTYKFELWGASGGTGIYHSNRAAEQGGLGAYTAGEIVLKKGQILYIYVGGQGANPSSISQHAYIAGGWNGGANGTSGGSDDIAAGGGGATDVRLIATQSITAWNNIDSLKSRIMVAAGGGGGHAYTNSSYSNRSVFRAIAGSGLKNVGNSGYWNGGTWQPQVTQTTGYAFGYGQQHTSLDGTHGAGGGGGGWYGGRANTNGNGGPGSGGTSYISGHEGCVGVKENATANNTSAVSIEDSYSYTGFIFTNTKMIDGGGYAWTNQVGSTVVNMPAYVNDTMMTGNEGNGYARITFIR